jgi:hypothetical protein
MRPARLRMWTTAPACGGSSRVRSDRRIGNSRARDGLQNSIRSRNPYGAHAGRRALRFPTSSAAITAGPSAASALALCSTGEAQSELPEELHTSTQPTCAVEATARLLVRATSISSNLSEPLHGRPAQAGVHVSLRHVGPSGSRPAPHCRGFVRHLLQLRRL